MLAANPDQLALLRQNNPRLAEAYQSGSLDEFAKAQSRPLIDWLVALIGYVGLISGVTKHVLTKGFDWYHFRHC
jgi:hypothetical protein